MILLGSISTRYDFHVNGDAVADFSLLFNGSRTLTAGVDLIL